MQSKSGKKQLKVFEQTFDFSSHLEDLIINGIKSITVVIAVNFI